MYLKQLGSTISWYLIRSVLRVVVSPKFPYFKVRLLGLVITCEEGLCSGDFYQTLLRLYHAIELYFPCASSERI